MLPRNHPDRIQIAFDDHRLVANAGLILPATLALRLGLPELLRSKVRRNRAICPVPVRPSSSPMTSVATEVITRCSHLVDSPAFAEGFGEPLRR